MLLVLGGCTATPPSHTVEPSASPIAADARPSTPLLRRTLPPDHRVVARRELRDATLVLTTDRDHTGMLFVIDGDEVFEVPCDPLPDAWGMWLDDVDADGRAEAIVALRRPARFDPGDHHRLHVYAFDRGRCVPLWRGTRLAGRFDAATVEPDRPATVLVHEWTAPDRRRVARYRWTGFGYALDTVLWRGDRAPPDALMRHLDHPPAEPAPGDDRPRDEPSSPP